METVTWIPTTKPFGARLALVRQHMSWSTVEEAARECGLSAANWRNWESGVNPRNFTEVVQKIVDRTGVDGAWLAIEAPGILGMVTDNDVIQLTEADESDVVPSTPDIVPSYVAVVTGYGAALSLAAERVA